MRLKGNLSISRSSSNRGPDVIRIEVEDKISGSRFLTIEMDLETYGKVVSGLSYQPVDLEYVENAPIGKTMEHKVEFVPFGDLKPWGIKKEQAASNSNY